MKKGLIFAATLAMALGVGAAVGAHQQKAARVKATDKTLYCKMEHSWWTVDNAAIAVYAWDKDNESIRNAVWPGVRMSAVQGDPNVWSGPVDTSLYNRVIFVRVNGSGTLDDWGAKTADLTIPTDAKDFYTITSSSAVWGDPGVAGEWSTYVAPDPEEQHNYSYSLNGAAAVEMTPGKGSEVESASLSFEKGDELVFKKDGAAYSVSPKDDSDYTKVKTVENKLVFAQDYEGKLYLDTSTAKLWAGRFEAGYYLSGVGGDWNIKNALPAALENGTGPAYLVEDVQLAAGAEIKFVQVPETGNNLAYKNAEAGKVTTGSEVAYSIVTEGLGTGNLQVTNAGTYDLYYNPESGYYSIEDVNYVPDEPAADGYYLASSKSQLKFNGATQMSTQGIAPENVAELLDYSAANEEVIQVRGFFDGEDPEKKEGVYGGSAIEGIGEANVQGQFVMSAAKHIDVFAKWEQKTGDAASKLYFYITEHAERYTISIYDVLFEGSAKKSVAAEAHSERATAGVNFTYELPAKDGYAPRELYTDSDCTTPYVAHAFEANGTLYAKYTRTGYYIVGDAAFSGSVDVAWDVDGATYLPAAVNDTEKNLLEGTILIPASASKESPVEVRLAQYNAAGELSYPDYSIANYPYATKPENNVKFEKGGTFAVYVNKSMCIYLNEGLDAFYTGFLTEVGGVCATADGTEGYIERLQAAWGHQKVAYQSLDPDQKAVIVAKTIDGGDEHGSDLEKVIAKYKRIVTKYGTEKFENFIWGTPYAPQSSVINSFNFTSENNTILFVTIGVTVAAIAALAFFVIRYKKKEE